jgi:hypothetical protein
VAVLDAPADLFEQTNADNASTTPCLSRDA